MPWLTTNVLVTERAAPRAEFVDPFRGRATATTGVAVLPTCTGTEDVSVGRREILSAFDSARNWSLC